MTALIEWINRWMAANPVLAPYAQWGGMILLSIVFYLIARFIIARALGYAARRTANKYDDILVARLQPFRFAWIAPVLVIFYAAETLPGETELIRQLSLFVILWLVIMLVNNLLDAINTIYEVTPLYHGNSIQGYLDLVKLLVIAFAIILTISLFTGQDPWVLLSGLGAVTAVLLLVFRDTLLSLVASMQIQTNELLKEGDWIEVPSYNADGTILNINLHVVKIQNFDMTISSIPTYKLLEVPYKNWRGMQESGGRRIKRSVYIDVNSVHFCTPGELDELEKIDLVGEMVRDRRAEIASTTFADDPFAPRALTNLGVFRQYTTQYLRNRPDIHQQGKPLVVRSMEPGPQGLPVELYCFTTTIVWAEYEAIQSSIFDHLIAVLPRMHLRLFQQPTGLDFNEALVPSE